MILFLKIWYSFGLLTWLYIVIEDYRMRGYEIGKQDFNSVRLWIIHATVLTFWPGILYVWWREHPLRKKK